MIPPQNTGPAFSKGYDFGITHTKRQLAVIFWDYPPYGPVFIRPCFNSPAAVHVIPFNILLIN